MKAKVSGVRSVELGVPDVAAARGFYRDAWGLEEVDEADGQVFLRGTGQEHHIVALSLSPQPKLKKVTLAAATEADVDRLFDAISGGKSIAVTERSMLPGEAGGGYGFDFMSPGGHAFAVTANVARRDSSLRDRSRPTKISHVVLNSSVVDKDASFLREHLGFRLSDSTRAMEFLRSGRDHHSIALAHSTRSSLNHIAFEMESIDGIMRGAGRMRERGFDMQWGLGRHGPGDNVFAYFVDPHGLAIEYTAEVEQIDEAVYLPHGKDYWAAYPKRPCRWGMAMSSSDRLKAAMAGDFVSARK